MSVRLCKSTTEEFSFINLDSWLRILGRLDRTWVIQILELDISQKVWRFLSHFPLALWRNRSFGETFSEIHKFTKGCQRSSLSSFPRVQLFDDLNFVRGFDSLVNQKLKFVGFQTNLYRFWTKIRAIRHLVNTLNFQACTQSSPEAVNRNWPGRERVNYFSERVWVRIRD